MNEVLNITLPSHSLDSGLDSFFGKETRKWWMGFAILMVILDHAV